MSKIVRFKTSQDSVIEALENLLERTRKGDVENFVFAAKCPGGEVATSWCNADVGTRQELVSHLQTDINFAVVEANVDRLIEWI